MLTPFLSKVRGQSCWKGSNWENRLRVGYIRRFCANGLVADKTDRKQGEEEENFRGVQPSAAGTPGKSSERNGMMAVEREEALTTWL